MNRAMKLAVPALLMCLPAAARAEWKEAASTNFIVYSEGGEAQLREFATKLEKFDYVLRAYHGVKAPPSPVRLKVYLFPDTAAVSKMAGGEGIAGYYISDARGLMMVGSRGRSRGAINARSGPDDDLRHKLAADFEKRDMIPEAIAIIRPVASVLPHRKSESAKDKKRREEREDEFRAAGAVKRESARDMLTRLEARMAAKKG